MNHETMDLFSDLAEQPAEAVALAAPAERPGAPAMATPTLELAMADSGRKAAFKTLSPPDARELEAAVALVSLAKRSAYDGAAAGEIRSAFGWAARQPALASAIAALNRAFIDSNAIPMAWTDVTA